MALMAMAAMLSTGGFAKHAHLWSAHSHVDCGGDGRTSCSTHPVRSLCGSGRICDSATATTAATNAATTTATANAPVAPRPCHVDGACAVCAELAFLTPTVQLESPFSAILAVLAIVHDREAAQLPDPAAPEVCAARPPPALA